jgi:cytochrome c biogenesis factor
MDTCVATPPAGSTQRAALRSLQRYTRPRPSSLSLWARHDPELGHFALILALAVALVQGTLPFVGASRGDIRLMALGRSAALTQALLVIRRFAALTQAYVTSDFSVANVVANSHSAKPLLYKISGVWGNHEGSMLLWALILALFGAAVARSATTCPTPCARGCWACRR